MFWWVFIALVLWAVGVWVVIGWRYDQQWAYVIKALQKSLDNDGQIVLTCEHCDFEKTVERAAERFRREELSGQAK